MSERVRIDPSLVDDYLASKPPLDELWDEVKWLPCDKHNGLAVNLTSKFVEEWNNFDSKLADLLKHLANNPHLVSIILTPNGIDENLITDRYIMTLGTKDSEIQRSHLRDKDAYNLIEFDPGFFLSKVKGASNDERRLAFNYWWNWVLQNTPISATELSLEVEASVTIFKIFTAEVSGKFAASGVVMADGTTKLTLEVDRSLGVGFDVKGAEGSVGLATGGTLTHEFASVEHAENFLAELQESVMGGDLPRAATLMLDSDSLTSGIVSVGMSGELELEFPAFVDFKFYAGAQVGYKRDFVAEEDIFFFEAEAEVEVDVSNSFEAKAGMAFSGEYHRSDSGSYVILSLQFDVSVGTGIDAFDDVFADLDLSAGGMVSAYARLDLEDPEAIKAWKSFLNPSPHSLTDLVRESDLILQVWEVAEVEVIDFDMGAGVVLASAEVNVDGSMTQRNVVGAWAKHQGGKLETVVGP